MNYKIHPLWWPAFGLASPAILPYLYYKNESYKLCVENIDRILKEIQYHFFGMEGKKQEPFWISFDIDSITKEEFPSTGTTEPNGIQLPFIMKFLEVLIPEAVGMDFSEVNFKLTEGEQTEKDKRTVRMLMEHIIKIAQKGENVYRL